MDNEFTDVILIVSSILNKPVSSIEKLPYIANNTVYKVKADQHYIFKLYKSSSWPEDGKLPFIHRLLEQQNIPTAKLLTFERHQAIFPSGYLLESFIEGVPADRIMLDDESGIVFYTRLAHLVSSIHRIPLYKFGYIGGGTPSHNSFIAFMNEKFDEIARDLVESKCLDNVTISRIKPLVFDKLMLCSDLPAVLNHGDLSTKNIIVQKEQLILIDWDDAMAYNWIADIARLTYWMKFNYSEQQYQLFRDSFLNQYGLVNDINLFHQVEEGFHVWIGMDHLNYYQHSPHYAPTLRYLNESIESLSRI